MSYAELPVPSHFAPDRVGGIWRVPYQERAEDARQWARQHGITPASGDIFKIGLLAVDVQNTFCIPEFELFVGGQSGTGAVDDNRRLCDFVYRNLRVLTQVIPTMDTHQAMQIFHSIYLVDEDGKHPDAFTLIGVEEIEQGRWKFDPEVARGLHIDYDFGQRHLLGYTKQLRDTGKYNLTVWPYHSMLGGIGHALVSAVEEAIFFHGIARYSQPDFRIKGSNPLTEHYSVLGPEVTVGPDGQTIAQKDQQLVNRLLEFDAIVIAGQAKSHCVAWTIDDLLGSVRERDRALARKVYLLEDCTSPVVIPGVIDYTGEADAAFRRFADAGMHVVRSTEPLAGWPGIEL
ncbi:MAG: isochorismatase [Acidiferrobacterales bacterium]